MLTALSVAGCTQVAGFFDNTPPADVTDVAADPLDQAVELTWENPDDPDFDGLRISRDGVEDVVLEPTEATYLIENLSNGTNYTFTIRTVDRVGNVSAGVSTGATPREKTVYTLSASWRSFSESGAFAAASRVLPSAVPVTGFRSAVGYAAATSSDDDAGAIIVKYRDSDEDSPSIQSSVRSILRSIGVERVLMSLDNARISKIVPAPELGMTVEALLDYLKSLPGVESAERDKRVYALGRPNDEYFDPYQWNLLQLLMPSVWDIQTGSSSVVVAVIDSGVDQSLTDLVATSFVSGYDFVNDDDDPTDDNGHGTHVAGTIAQSTNNTRGVAGMAYGVSIMPIKVLGADGNGHVSHVIAGIQWAVDNGADIINLSLGASSSSPDELDAVKYAYEAGVVVVAASGNDNASVSYPAAYHDYVLAVGATKYDKIRAPYSNYGASLDVVAPGGYLYTETGQPNDQNGDGYPDGILQQTIGPDPNTPSDDLVSGYFFFEGTSMAAPHAAALAALMLSRNPGLTPEEVYATIRESADDLGDSGRDDYYGYGLINPTKALNLEIYDVTAELEDSVQRQYNTVDRWNVDAAGGTIQIDLTFAHSGGNLDLVLVDPAGTVV
ncbi:MAG: S8 family serine peptidase, partial [bacterium]